MSLDLSQYKLNKTELSKVSEILSELITKGNSKSYDNLLDTYYEDKPVYIDEFLENKDYLGISTDGGKGIYPYWKNTLGDIFHSGKAYDEIIFEGAIGLGKSLIGDIIGCYQLHKLLCLRNPQAYYGLVSNTPIVFAFLNIHKYLASGVAYGQFQELLQKSPWFVRHGDIRGRYHKEYYPNHNIQFVTGSTPEHVIGMNIFFAMLDEMSFAKKPNADILKAGIMDLYRSITARQTSRFVRDGILQSKSVLISSKRSDSDFLDQYAQTRVGVPTTFIVDEPQWKVKPEGTFSKETFRIAVGSKTKKSIILSDDDKRTEEELKVEGFTQVIEPPVTLKSQFEFDMDAKLRDLAGISTTVFTKFIDYFKLKLCYSSKLVNPFTDDEFESTVLGSDSILDHFHQELVPEWITKLPIFIHCDIALSGDGYGIGATAAAGLKNQYKIQTGEMVMDPVFIHVFSARIRAPKGEQVSLEKVRQFIYWLKYTLGWNIKRCSYDGFNSADSIQQMKVHGIDADLISLDRVPCNGYLALRSAIYEKRLVMIKVKELENELLDLERNEMTGKVDHPVNGAKDSADGLAGSLYNASLHQEVYSEITSSIESVLEVNEDKDINNDVMDDLSKQLTEDAKKLDKSDPMKNIVTDEDTIDDIMTKVTNTNEDDELDENMRNYYASMGILI